ALTSLQSHFGEALSVRTLTADHWRGTLGSARTLGAISRSLALAIGAALGITCLGTAIALARPRIGRAGAALQGLALWPYAVPGTVLAMALLATYSRDLRFILLDRIAFVLALANTPWLLLVAYGAKYLALG